MSEDLFSGKLTFLPKIPSHHWETPQKRGLKSFSLEIETLRSYGREGKCPPKVTKTLGCKLGLETQTLQTPLPTPLFNVPALGYPQVKIYYFGKEKREVTTETVF